MEQPEPPPHSTTTTSAPRAPVSRRSRWLGSVVALLVLAAIGWWAWHLTRPVATAGGPGASAPGGAGGGGGRGPGGGGGGRGAPPSTVGVAVAKRADIPVIIEALGTVLPVASVTVQPQVSGVLTQVLFKEGQMVRKGELLATIAPEPFQMALQQATGARLRDEAQLQAAQVTLQRYQTLLAQDSIARQEVDTQAALVKQLQGTVTIDRANEGTARLNLGYTRIVAPIAGRVGLRPVDAGNSISTSTTGGIALITQVAPIDVEFAIPQDRVPEIQARTGSGATLSVAAWDRSRTRQLDTGTFSTLDNQIDTTTGTVRAKARFANAQGALFPNQFVNARLLLRTITESIVVPVTALRHGPSGDFVYVINEDRTVTLRNVTRGEAGVDNVAITAGLALGEQVVTEGGDRLKDGSRVQTAVDRPAGAASGGAAGPRGRRGGAASGASAAAYGDAAMPSASGPRRRDRAASAAP